MPKLIISSKKTQKFWLGWAVSLGVALLPAVLATLPPFLGPAGRALVMQAFASLCHQLPAYSPHLGGVQLAVGHRVYGVLWGLALGTIVFLRLCRWDETLDRHAALVLGTAALPMALDWGLHAAGWWAKTPASRLVTGLLFGLGAGYFWARAVVNLFSNPPVEKPPHGSHPEAASADRFRLEAMPKEEARLEKSTQALEEQAPPRRGRTLWRWFLLAAGLVLTVFLIREVLFPFRGQPYMEIGHGNHTHYVPKDRNETVPVSSFPMVEPGPKERITPDGDLVPKNESTE